MNIVLCGMPTSGKTSVAAALAALIGWQAVDTDCLIKQRYGAIPDIFADHGEEYFRELESKVIVELAAKDGLIIATGGGAVLWAQNVTALQQNGKICYLQTSLSTLLTRAGAGEGRPLLSGDTTSRLTKLYGERTPLYAQVANFTIATDGKTPQQIAQLIAQHFGV
jgi:shikimate kinase